MRHAVRGYKLGRDTEHRRALFRNLATALFQHGQIRTTRAKAKAVQPFVEKLITIARRGDLHSRRRVLAELRDRELVHVLRGGQDERVEEKTLLQKLFDEIAPRYLDRPGGYTRIVKLPNYRKGDGADLVVLQLVGEEEEGPRVRGRHSRRRQKQINRTNFAAKLRKGGKAEGQTAGASTAESGETQSSVDEDTSAQQEADDDSDTATAEPQADTSPAEDASQEKSDEDNETKNE